MIYSARTYCTKHAKYVTIAIILLLNSTRHIYNYASSTQNFYHYIAVLLLTSNAVGFTSVDGWSESATWDMILLSWPTLMLAADGSTKGSLSHRNVPKEMLMKAN